MTPSSSSLLSMFHLARRAFKVVLLVLFLLLGTPATYAQPPPPGENPCEFITLPTGKIVRWYGYANRTYFVQISDTNNPLGKWTWAPIIEAGNNALISYEVDGTASKSFFRLKPTDLPIPSGKTIDTADFDEDGISNIDEIKPPTPLLASYATDPLDADTDHDGLPDAYERTYGLDPNDAGSIDPVNGPNGDPDGDGLTNAEELVVGTLPNDADTDGDGASDGIELAAGSNPNSAASVPSADPFVAYEFKKLVAQQGFDQPLPIHGYGSWYSYQHWPFIDGTGNDEVLTFFPAAIAPATVHSALLGYTYRSISSESSHLSPQGHGWDTLTLTESGGYVYGPSLRIFALSHDISNPYGPT